MKSSICCGPSCSSLPGRTICCRGRLRVTQADAHDVEGAKGLNKLATETSAQRGVLASDMTSLPENFGQLPPAAQRNIKGVQRGNQRRQRRAGVRPGDRLEPADEGDQGGGDFDDIINGNPPPRKARHASAPPKVADNIPPPSAPAINSDATRILEQIATLLGSANGSLQRIEEKTGTGSYV